MRYKIGEEMVDLPSANHSSDSTFFGTAIYGLIIGVGFVIAGIKAKQYWLAFWGVALVIASVASIVVMY